MSQKTTKSTPISPSKFAKPSHRSQVIREGLGLTGETQPENKLTAPAPLLGEQTKDWAGRSAEANQLLGMVKPAIHHLTPDLRLGSLTQADVRFLMDMLEKWEQYGKGLQVSVRQLFWLRDVKDKLVADGLV